MTHDKQSERDGVINWARWRASEDNSHIPPGTHDVGEMPIAHTILALKTSLDEAKAEIERLKYTQECTNSLGHERIEAAEKERDEALARALNIESISGNKIERLQVQLLENQAENERLKADCVAMREALGFYSRLENFGKTVWENPETQDGKCWYEPFDSYEIGEIYGESNTGDFGLLAEEALEPASGSDLLAELKALRKVAQAAFDNNELKLTFAFAQLANLKEKNRHHKQGD